MDGKDRGTEKQCSGRRKGKRNKEYRLQVREKEKNRARWTGNGRGESGKRDKPRIRAERRIHTKELKSLILHTESQAALTLILSYTAHNR